MLGLDPRAVTAAISRAGVEQTTALWLAVAGAHAASVRVLLAAGVEDRQYWGQGGYTLLDMALLRVHQLDRGVQHVKSTDSKAMKIDAAASQVRRDAQQMKLIVHALRAAGACAPSLEPRTMLNKRIEVEGRGLGRVVDVPAQLSHLLHVALA